jgi:phage/plasmid-like protein (TIGR03299 family)
MDAVETAVYANTPAWHRKGVVLDSNGNKGLTIQEVLDTQQLSWEVAKVPAFAVNGIATVEMLMEMLKADPNATIKVSDLALAEDRFCVQRNTDGKVFGTVGNGWAPFQPLDAFDVVDELIKQAGGKTWVEGAMALDGGKKIVVMVHLDTGLQIAGEKYATYLTFVTGFDGRTSTMVFVHTERIVCANTLAIGLGQGKGSGRIIRVRHSKNAADRIKQAHEILGIRNVYLEELAKQGEWLVEQEMPDSEFAAFMDSLMPVPEVPEDKDSTPASTMAEGRREVISKLYFDAPNLKPITGTRWGALQAVIEYADHKRPFKDEESQIKAQIGFTEQQTEIKDRAFSILRSPGLIKA